MMSDTRPNTTDNSLERSSPNVRRGKSPRRPPISALIVEGYKSLETYTRLEMRRLTLLAGGNSSGKSSAIQPMLLLKQTLEAPYDPGALLIDGPNVTFTQLSQMLPVSIGQPAKTFSIGVEVHGSQTTICKYSAQSGTVKLVEMLFGNAAQGQLHILREGMRLQTIRRNLPKSVREFFDNTAKTTASRGRSNIRVTRERCFLSVTVDLTGGHAQQVVAIGTSPAGTAMNHIRGAIHVPALRGNPQRLYRKIPVTNAYPGRFEEYVASIVAAWQATSDPRLEILGDQLHTLELTWGVAAIPINDTQVELRVGRLPDRLADEQDMVSLADVGFGVSQVLPVLVALLAAEPDDIVYLEEPEIHLHPKAQYLMGRIIADTVQKGIQVIVETHSALLLRAIQTSAATGSMDHSEAMLHWFSRSKADGQTVIASADLDAKGRFGNWPVDFDDVTLWVEDEFLTAASAR